MKKHLRFLCLIIMSIILGVFLFTNIGVLTGKYEINYQGFAIDSNGNVYIGTSSKIKIYNGGCFIKSIYPQTNRGYEFTIAKDDMIYILTGTGSYYMNIDGELIKHTDEGRTTLRKYRPDKGEFITSEGIVYKQKINFGRTKIIKENGDKDETVFIMPLNDYCAKLAWYSSIIFMFILAFVLLIHKTHKRDKTGDGSMSRSISLKNHSNL